MMKPKKSLGQHFLKSRDALRKIIQAGEISRDDVILEIGPGKGALTEQLLAFGCQVLAIEKDKELVQYLQEKFEKEIKEKRLILTQGDILKLKIYKLISNIPYNITGAILKKFLADEIQPERMVLLVQKEVAQRILASEGKESILSISVKAYGKPKMAGKVQRRYFSPEPKVDSAIIAITNISRKIFAPTKVGAPTGVGEERFWEIVKKGFAHKRKKLAGNLKDMVPREKLADFGNKRAEDLALDDWIFLAR